MSAPIFFESVRGQAICSPPVAEGEDENSIGGYLAALRYALIHDNLRRVNGVGREADYGALKRGIECAGVQ